MNQKKEFTKWQEQELGLVKLKRKFVLNKICPLVNGLIPVETDKIAVGSLGLPTGYTINCLTWMTNSLWWLPITLEESKTCRSDKTLVKICAPRDV